jgi:amino acid adenylation domain-containing protein
MSNQAVAGFRLSTQQERTWSHLPANSVAPFWAECVLAVSGPLERVRLERVIHETVARHEILRTAFHRQPGVTVPFQVILPSSEFVWKTADLSSFDEAIQSERLSALVGERDAAIDLEKGPVLHVVLARTSSSEHRLVLSLPGLCADSRSMQNLADEVVRGYARGFGAADEIIQYADIAQWQQDLLISDESKAGRDYWRAHCRKIDFDAQATVLSPFERPSTGKFSPEVVSVQIELQTLAASAGNNVSEFLLSAWWLFLARMTGLRSLAIGCQFEGRNYAELAASLGAFAKSLPLTCECTDGITFRELVSQIHDTAAEFGNWQDSFVWNTSGLTAGQEHEPALPVAFEFNSMPNAMSAGGLAVTVLRQACCAEQFAIKLSVDRYHNLFNLRFQFDANRLSRETVERWSRNFLTLLFAAVAEPATAIDRLPLLHRAERERLLVEWNQTAVDYSRENCIHELFERQVARTPNHPAVRYEDGWLTFEQLNERANQLAHLLRSKGVGKGSLVGLCLERSTNMMVAVLGILKAGGAYVPISAEHPKPRLEQQLSGTVALITERKFEGVLPSGQRVTILIDTEQVPRSESPVTNPPSVAHPDDLAYVIYTSGSTGTPKGVAVRHRNLVNYTSFIQRRLQLDKCVAPLHFATVSTLGADLGNTCIYPSLVSGGCLHIIGSEVAADSQRLQEYMAKYPVDVLKIVPSHLMALLQAGGGREVLPRRHLVLGGEAFTIALLEKIIAAHATCEVLNHYGPTETTVGSLTLPLKDFSYKTSSAQSVPIGRPIANTRIYILDAHDEPVPIGVAGELYIAGDGVTAGYVGQPERTAERFVPERFGPDPKALMYRTGDLVRYLPDGNVEFLGRADDQVKIRGFRIELGEVEAVLLRHAGIQQAIALALVDERGEKSLVAYFVGIATPDDVRAHLRSELPDYMIPSAVIQLPKLPLNANGKIDRQALPKPDDVKTSAKEAVAPRTPSEEVVASIWAEVLKRDNLGVEDNFFEIGGHSLLATQIASRLREHFNTLVPVRAVFEFPSIAELARHMDTIRREEQGILPPPITPVPRNAPLPLSYAQERLWVLDQIEPNNPLYNIPRALRLRGPLRAEALERAINEIVRRHESQRTSFAVYDGDPVQIIEPTLMIPLQGKDLTEMPEEQRETEARRLITVQAMRPFDLQRPPLVRAYLLRLSSTDHVLQLTMHHIISDAWSAGIFLQELTVLYDAFCEGKASPLPELRVQYADYAAQERGWLQDKVLEKHLAYWRKHLKGAPPVIELPLDRPRPQARTFAGACEVSRIPSAELAGVKELARQEGATLFMVLLAVFQTMLARYSGEDQIVIGTDLANRTMPETERMIGFFINLLAVRSDLSGNPTFREFLGRVREVLLESYAHQEVPFPKVVQEVQPERSATHNPIVQVLFVMQNIPRGRRELAGLQVDLFEVPITSSKFDMAVFLGETEQGLSIYWVYSTELFDQSTIQRIGRHFSTLMRSVCAQPDLRLSALTVLSPEEIEQQKAEKQQRKKSQVGMLKTTTPASVGLTSDDGGGKS